MKLEGTVRAVCTSPAKGTEKRPVEKGILIRDYGMDYRYSFACISGFRL